MSQAQGLVPELTYRPAETLVAIMTITLPMSQLYNVKENRFFEIFYISSRTPFLHLGTDGGSP